ncbi:hypothetical protein [Pseudomonas sp. DP16D-R1]|jgi:hypothetical protein|uniref:hypothetical protein n=1 Tax=Pseudomonas sp. DP16D-R1 TaxID=2075551 RepID=UPI0011AF8D70|nr:hypothetical protein [Pseudomonas sp. DP16D-R1]
MNLTQMMFALGDFLASCELKLLAAQKEHAVSELCRDLCGAINVCAYIGFIARDKGAKGLANAICPLHDRGIADDHLVPGLEAAGLIDLRMELQKRIQQIRLRLIVDEMAGAPDVVSNTLGYLRTSNPGLFEDNSSTPKLDSLVEERSVLIGRAMKMGTIEMKVKFLLGLGVNPDQIYGLVSQPN